MGAKASDPFNSEFGPHFKTVAKSWSKVNPELRNQHFFATLDFADAVDVFRRVSYQPSFGVVVLRLLIVFIY